MDEVHKTKGKICSYVLRCEGDRIYCGPTKDLEVRMLAALVEGEKQLLKWSAEVWTRGRHLFGAVCDEKYRRGFARKVSILTILYLTREE